MDTKKVDDIIKKYREDKKISKDDKEYIYTNYITYINKKEDFDNKEKDLILKHLRNMIVHGSKLLLIDELDNSINDILRTSAEKKILANNLKRYMDRRKLNVNELANKLDLPYSTVNDWVNEVSYPRRDKLRLLANTFNISIKDLTEDHKSLNGSVIVPVLGNIPAGIPIEAIEDITDYEEIPQSWLTGDKEYFGLKIKGKSMYPNYMTRRYCYL